MANSTQDNDGPTLRERLTEGNTGAVIGAAAVGLAAGLAANLGRKAVVQGMSAATGDWAAALAAEHAAVLKVFDQLQATDDTDERKRSTLLATMKHALTKHAVQEENTVYPALRDAGELAGADELNHEHGYVKQYFYDLDEMSKSDPAWLPKLREFHGFIKEHMSEEEDDLFPRLRGMLSEAQNKQLTAKMNREGLKLA